MTSATAWRQATSCAEALGQKIIRDLSFSAARWNGPTQALDDEARWNTARRLLHDEALKPVGPGIAAGQAGGRRGSRMPARFTMTTMEPVPAVVHLDSHFINFRDFDFLEGSHGYRWVDAKRFQLSSEALDDRDVLAALIAHPQFRDTYDGAGVQDWPRHGQWWLDRITPDSYETIDAATAVNIIHSWANQHGTAPKSLTSRLRQEIYTPICTATSRYLLGQLPEDTFHDYGPIHIDYHELVLVDRPAATLTLLVAADD